MRAADRVRLVLIGSLGLGLAPFPARAGQTPGGAPPRVDVCALVPKAEVRKHLPWEDLFDRMPLENDTIGATGASCGYPTVHVQVLAYTPTFLDAARKSGPPLEPVAGLGDEAWFRNNRDRFAEVFVKVGARILTLQASADRKVSTVRPGVIELARVFVAKLR